MLATACSETARVLTRLDRRHKFRRTPVQSASLPGSPGLTEMLDSLHVVDDLGRWWVGAEAVLQIARRVPVVSPVTFLARLPLGPWIFDAAYRAVADHRQQLSRVLGLDACRDPSHWSTGHRHEGKAASPLP